MSSRFTEQEMEIMKTGLLSRRRQSQPPENQELIEEIDRTRNTIESARNHFEQVVDPTLIDCYIYELKAAQLRYQFLLRRFKLMEEL
jgi:hypothetical protein